MVVAPPTAPVPTPSSEPPSPRPTLETPTILAVVAGLGSITLQWNAVENALAYHVQVSSTLEALSSTEPVVVSSTKYSFSVEPGSRVYFRVRAVSGSSEAPVTSDWTEPARATHPLAVPMGLRTSRAGPDFIEWRWDTVHGATEYQVQTRIEDGPVGQALSTTQTTYRHSVSSGATAYARVRAVATSGDETVVSEWSEQVVGMSVASQWETEVVRDAITGEKVCIAAHRPVNADQSMSFPYRGTLASLAWITNGNIGVVGMWVTSLILSYDSQASFHTDARWDSEVVRIEMDEPYGYGKTNILVALDSLLNTVGAGDLLNFSHRHLERGKDDVLLFVDGITVVDRIRRHDQLKIRLPWYAQPSDPIFSYDLSGADTAIDTAIAECRQSSATGQ